MLVTTVSLTGLAACGSRAHPAAARTSLDPTTTTTAAAAPTTTPTTVARPHRRPPPPIVSPLTGLPTTLGDSRRPAVVVKIDNISGALPQTGPNQADVVYEEMVEGGLTRLAAVFQSLYPDPVGPVRSGRLTDEGIADDLGHPVLLYAGANALFQPQLAAQPLTDLDDDIAPGLFSIDYSREAPHNTYANVAGAGAMDTTQRPPPALWKFRRSGRPLTGAGATPAASISIGFPAASVTWTWNATARLWLRSQNGAIDLDAAGVQLNASNVVVQFIPYITSAIVTGEGAGADGGPIPEGEFVGSGAAWYLSDGAIVKGTWSRASLTTPTVWKDSAGATIKLQPGRTWVELPQVGTVPTVSP